MDRKYILVFEDISIVLVTRNRKWYNKALPKLIETWDTIVKKEKKDTNIENQINEKKRPNNQKNKNTRTCYIQ